MLRPVVGLDEVRAIEAPDTSQYAGRNVETVLAEFIKCDSEIQQFGRFDGPLNLRLILQPCIAVIFGYLDGTKGARDGGPPYFWSVTNVPPLERQALINRVKSRE